MGTPSKTILNQLRYLHAKFGSFVQSVTIFSLSHLTITDWLETLPHSIRTEYVREIPVGHN